MFLKIICQILCFIHARGCCRKEIINEYLLFIYVNDVNNNDVYDVIKFTNYLVPFGIFLVVVNEHHQLNEQHKNVKRALVSHYARFSYCIL